MNDLMKMKIHIETKGIGCETSLRGSTPALLSGLSVLIKTLRENGIDKDLIEHAVEVGFMTEKELERSANQRRNKLKEALKDMLKDLN